MFFFFQQYKTLSQPKSRRRSHRMSFHNSSSAYNILSFSKLLIEIMLLQTLLHYYLDLAITDCNQKTVSTFLVWHVNERKLKHSLLYSLNVSESPKSELIEPTIPWRILANYSSPYLASYVKFQFVLLLLFLSSGICRELCLVFCG